MHPLNSDVSRPLAVCLSACTGLLERHGCWRGTQPKALARAQDLWKLHGVGVGGDPISLLASDVSFVLDNKEKPFPLPEED